MSRIQGKKVFVSLQKLFMAPQSRYSGAGPALGQKQANDQLL